MTPENASVRPSICRVQSVTTSSRSVSAALACRRRRNSSGVIGGDRDPVAKHATRLLVSCRVPEKDLSYVSVARGARVREGKEPLGRGGRKRRGRRAGPGRLCIRLPQLELG